MRLDYKKILFTVACIFVTAASITFIITCRNVNKWISKNQHIDIKVYEIALYITESEVSEEVTEPTETTEESTENTEAIAETIPDERPSEYEAAHIIWDFLKDNGYSDIVAAGIMGNIMAECGGNTLSLQTEVYGGNYYGICQWSSYYFPEVQGQNLEYQLNYLQNTMQSQFGSHHDNFLKINDVRSAAKSFAVWYERCAEWSYGVRMANAQHAYEYFCE